jgi:hypothetical protein
MVNPINPSGKEPQVKPLDTQTAKTPTKTPTTTEPKSETTTTTKYYNQTDQLDIGNTEKKSATYTKPTTNKPDMNRIEELKKEADKALQPLKDMVKELLRQQGIAYKEAGFESTDDTLIDIPPELRAEAQKSIADDGEYGIEKTATRLADFAKAISGEDKSKLDTLRKAIQDGYNEAEKAFGGTLPDISKKTLELTMKKLDEWAES